MRDREWNGQKPRGNTRSSIDEGFIHKIRGGQFQIRVQARLNRHSAMTLASALHLCRCATTHAVAAREVTWHHRRITAVFRARALLRWFCATMAAASLCATTARQSSRALCRARRLWALYAASAAALRGPALRTRSRHVCTARAASAAAACRLAIAACTRAARWRRQQSSAALA